MLIVCTGMDTEAAMRSHLSWLRDPWITRYLECRWRKWEMRDIRQSWQEWGEDPCCIARWMMHNGKAVGTVKLTINKHNGFAEIGYMVGDRGAQGNGVATRHVLAMLRNPALGNVRYVRAGCHASNIASQRVLEKCGFELVGREPNKLVGPNGVEDCLLYGIQLKKRKRK